MSDHRALLMTPRSLTQVLQFYKQRGFKGVVIDGMGAGNIGASLAAVAKPLATAGKFKVVVSKVTADGTTDPGYGCPGCLGELIKDGVVQALNLDAFKSRIVLMLELAQRPNIKGASLQAQYDKISYPFIIGK
jgi:L-asparaginase/Glu-tRNA(Gln) amidotransferase subunit D